GHLRTRKAYELSGLGAPRRGERSGRGGRARSRKLPVLRGKPPHTTVPRVSLTTLVRHATAASPSFAPWALDLCGNGPRQADPRWRSPIPFLSAPPSPPSPRRGALPVPSPVVDARLSVPEVARPRSELQLLGDDPAVASEVGAISVRRGRRDVEAIGCLILAGRTHTTSVRGEPVGGELLLLG